MTRYVLTRENATPQRWCDWFFVSQRLWKMRCCDCALVHDFQFRLVGRRIQIRARRNHRATAACRRRKAL